MWFVYLSLALQIYFGIHAIKTGRPFVWVLVIILFSVLGVAGYILVELAPEWWVSRGGRKVKNAIGNTVDPEKALKAAKITCDKIDSVQNRLILAEEFMKLERFQEAHEIYGRCLAGVHAGDPQIMLGMAKAEFGLNNFQAVIELLDKLKADNPRFKSPEGHLLYARALEGSGRIVEAIQEYDSLNQYYSTPEPACRLAQIHKTRGNHALAMELFQSVVKRSASAGSHFNEINKDWIKLARREAGSN
jgi:hypothetical protein